MDTIEQLKNKLETISSALAEKQPALAKALEALDTAETDETKSVAEIAVTELSQEIDSLKQMAQVAYDNYNRLTPVNFTFESVKSAGGFDVSKLEEILNNLEVKTATTPFKKRTPGQFIGDYLKSQGVKNEETFEKLLNRTGKIPFTFCFDDSDEIAKAEVNALTSIKSLYSNGGTELVVSSVAVPGFQGYGCSTYEVTDEGRLCLEPSYFTDFLTVRNMPAAGSVQYDYPVSRTDAANGVLETVYNPYSTKVQNGQKPEGTFTYNTARVKVSKIAEIVTASDEVLDDCSKIADRIDYFLMTGLEYERNRQLVAGDGTGGDMVGLLNQPGTLALDSDDLIIGIDSPNIWDRIYLAKLELEKACAVVEAVFVNPADKAKVALAKDDNGNYLFQSAMNCEVDGVGCLVLRTSPHIPEGTAIMGEFKNNWVWYNRKNLSIDVGLTGDQFITNTKTFRAELRGAAVLFNPQKVGIVTNI